MATEGYYELPPAEQGDAMERPENIPDKIETLRPVLMTWARHYCADEESQKLLVDATFELLSRTAEITEEAAKRHLHHLARIVNSGALVAALTD